MPAEIKSLAEALRDAKTRITRAPQVALKLAAAVTDLEAALSMTDALTKEVVDQTAEVRGLLGVASNFPPPDEPPKG